MSSDHQKELPTVVGIGASAGGLAALKLLFRDIPRDSGLVFVVVVHLSPEHESHLADLLQPHLPIPVQQVMGNTAIKPDHVYVIPPGRNLSAIDTHLRLSELEPRRQERAPIDHFFRTLASAHDGHAIGIILSGTGSDGTLGIRDIKAKGGLTIVQDPNEAEYDGMPQSAIATGVVDLVLPVNQIVEAVLRFARTEPRIPLPHDGEKFEGDERLLLQKVFVQLRARTGRDFSRYKTATLMRRIARRMRLNQIEEFSHYVERLRQQPEEARALSDDLLITVTNFFRDAEVFEKLDKEIFPQIFDSVGPAGTVRAWSVGCATGEEAYSLAMLLIEKNSKREIPVQIQVFASDLHERSLAKAREGVYPGDIETDVSPERIKRFFQKQNGGYRIRREVREVVIFTPHNLLADPPFSRINLISCRNLLIYLQRQVQRDVVELFHYALAPKGFLILGTSEAIETPDLFHTEDKAARLYRKRNVPGPEPRLPVFPIMRGQMTGDVERIEAADHVVAYGALHQRMVERYAPPSVLVSPDGKVVHFSENAGIYFSHSGGEPTTNIFKLIRQELRIELRSLIHDAQMTRKPVRSRPTEVSLNGNVRYVAMHVIPAPEHVQDGFLLVIFDESEPQHEVPQVAALPSQAASDAHVNALQAEQELLRQRLHAILEEHETSREEMKAANEELQSTNEELRSTLEELETSKEELQSMNEELQTVNQENRHKVEELAMLSSDLQNLLSATEIATLFLDRELRILRFTPKVGDLFSVRMTDRGRPISDLTHRLGYDQMKADAEGVLEKLIPVERQVQDETGRWYLTRVLPYRSPEDRIDGVVMTFVDITEQKRSEVALRQAQEELAGELMVMVHLHELVGRLMMCADLEAALKEVLIATIELSGADMGIVQLVSAENGSLQIAAHRGFDKDFLEHFQAVSLEDESVRAFKNAERVVVGDVGKGDFSPKYREVAEAAGYRAVQSTPLLSFRGKSLGVLSTHWRIPHYPSERELRALDVYCRQASEFIERTGNEEALRDSDKRKDQFLAILAHELRNPLTPVRSAAELLRRSGGDPEMRARATDAIERHVIQLAHLVDDLLDVSRLNLGVIRLRKETVAVDQYVRQALEVVQSAAEAKGQELHVDIEDGLFVEADPVRLTQILANLLNNACKFTRPGGKIGLKAAREGQHIKIRIQDSGDGIPPGQIQRIFEMFAQVNTSLERSESGLGIGLTLAKHLAEMHGGTIEAQSEGAGQGSLFTVVLPALTSPREKISGIPTTNTSAGTQRILIVDDNRDVADSLAMLLQMNGHEVKTAYDGAEALEVSKIFEPHVVFLDLGLPKMNGYQVAPRLRAQHADRKMTIVAVSGWNQPDDLRRSTEAGFNAHLVKPVGVEDLEKVMLQLS